MLASSQGDLMTTPDTSTAQVAGAAGATEDPNYARRWIILAVLATAQLMVVLDATIVNIALPHAQAALHFSNADRQWIGTAYSLAFGSLLLLGGRISDLIGRKRAFIIGLIRLAGASALGGLTTTFTVPKERARAFGIFGAIAGAGGAVGLLLGGVLTQQFNWRWN